MKKMVLLFGIILLSINSYTQINFSKYVEGAWESYKVCIIPTQKEPTIEGSTIAYDIDNYGFIIIIKKFLWFKKYILKSTNGEIIYNIDKSDYLTTNIPNDGSDGVVIGKIRLSNLRMETGKCNCLIDNISIKTYDVVLYRNGDLMIWIPEITDPNNIDYTDIYLKSIHWTRFGTFNDEPQIPTNPPFPVIPVYTTQKR